jgi:allantoinase
MAAWGGVASLELGLSAVWSEARRRGAAAERLAEWMCAAPARLAGLDRKGVIAPGRDADFVIWDPDAERTVSAEALAQRHKVTPYAGRRLPGVVAATYLRGRPIYEHGEPSEEPEGTLLTRLHR